MLKYTLLANLWYPRDDTNELRTDETPTEVQVGLTDVRAADDILIRYDFDRDGYAIFQQPISEDDGVGEWQEVAFIEAWNLDKTGKL